MPVPAPQPRQSLFLVAYSEEKEYNNGVLQIKIMCMLDEIRAKRDEIYAVARAHKAEKLWVFGSCARKEETPESDVDFLVKFGESIGLFELFDFEQELTDRVGRKVDLVNATALEHSPCFAYNVKKEMLPL